MPRLTRVPSLALETLRILVVLFGATLGYVLGAQAGRQGKAVLGAFDAPVLGLVVGALLGYVVGGVVARWVLRTIDRTEQALQGLSPEQLVAGSLGMLVAVLLAAAFTWPVFLVVPVGLALPVFLFVLVVAGLFGFRVGRRRRDAVLDTLGGRAGLAPRPRTPGSRPRLVDTSVAIDGRVIEVVRSGFLHGRLLVCEPVLGELQAMADSSDDLRRAKGRRGLAVLEALRQEPGIDVEVIGDEAAGVDEVDAKLIRMGLDRGAALLTFDTNLAKVAALSGVQVLNMHTLALALRPPVTAGDHVAVLLTRAGKEPGQAVGYLDDGTMIVVERAGDRIGQEVSVVVTSVLTTANGRLVFARLGAGTGSPPGGAVPPGRHDPVEAVRRAARDDA